MNIIEGSESHSCLQSSRGVLETLMTVKTDRRAFLVTAGSAVLAGFVPKLAHSQSVAPPKQLVLGQVEAVAAGNTVLAEGGNAVDAIVAAALVAGVVAVPLTGIGGYGGHLIVGGLPGGKTVSIDFNTAAPAALTEDYFHANEKGEVKDDVHAYGWLGSGVPGVLAGLQKGLDLYGTKKFAELVKPAVRFARDGFAINRSFAGAIKTNEKRLRADAGSAKLFFTSDRPLREGERFRNPDLAGLLETLAEAGNVASFYRGKIAESIVAANRKGGGILTLDDFAKYQARVETPLTIEWNGYRIHTPPPASGGLTVVESLNILKALGWPSRAETRDLEFIEAMRASWTDRFQYLGDPVTRDVPIRRLLSEGYAKEVAAKIRKSMAEGKPIEGKSDGRSATGTIHLNAIDSHGLAVALTFTHGDYLGAQVTVDGLGLTLGQGMSRFDPPGRANSPGPGKRPLHNMCPTIVTRDEAVVLAIGATGGRRIVNAVTSVLAARLGEKMTLLEAVKAPRIHTEGDLAILADAELRSKEWLVKLGFSIKRGAVASLNGIEREGYGNLIGGAR